ncbi:MAG TPA: hypothetical protein VLQ93_25430, partial [Myxococcaceae bacterium]|nr:hypothetical protein [Myxococcaceae bacterium]
MPRTFRFEHFTAAKPDVSKQKRGSEREPHPPIKSEQAEPAVEGLHYGHRHAQTEELYKKHREEHEREAARAEPVIHGKEEPGRAVHAPLEPEGRERRKELAQQAVSSVVEAAREAAKGRPLKAGKKLAGEAVTGARKVARE